MNTYKLAGFLWILLWYPMNTASQNAVIDSLMDVVHSLPDNEQKGYTLIRLSRELYTGAQSKHYAREAVKVAKTIQNDTLLGVSYMTLAKIFGIELNVDSFNVFSSLAEQHFKATDNDAELFSIYLSRATVLANFRQRSAAEQNFEKALEISKSVEDPYARMSVLNNWSIFHFEHGEYAASIDKIRRALRIYRDSNLTRIDVKSRLEFNIGRSLRAAEQYEEALYYLKHAYLKRRQINLTGGIGESQHQFLKLWLDLVKDHQDTTLYSHTIRDIGYSDSFVLLDSLYQLAKRSGHTGVRSMYYDISTLAYEAMGNYKQALINYRQERALNDSIMLDEKNIKALANLRVKYDNEVLENQVLRSKIAQANSVNQRNLLLLVLLFVILLSGIILLYVRQRLRAREISLQLEAQKVKDLQKQQQLIAINAMMEGQENERARIAKDLHDGLGNMLTTIRYQISGLACEPENQIALVQSRAESLIDEACSEVRKIAHNMMPRALKQLGFVKALKGLCAKQEALYGYEVVFQSFGAPILLPENTGVILYRIAQEVFNNINKHAAATEVFIQLTYDKGWLNLTFEDDGRGFEKKIPMAAGGIGLQSIQSRAALLGGECLIDSRPGKGTNISINIPLHP